MTEQEIERLIDAQGLRNRQALDHVRSIAAAHNADLPGWCARRLRRENVARFAVAACLFVTICTVYSSALAKPSYAHVQTTTTLSDKYVCDIVRHTMESA